MIYKIDSIIKEKICSLQDTVPQKEGAEKENLL